jgi:hypothetical protein
MINRSAFRTYTDLTNRKEDITKLTLGFNYAQVNYKPENQYKIYIDINGNSVELNETQARDFHEQLGAMLDIPPVNPKKPLLGISGQDFTNKD